MGEVTFDKTPSKKKFLDLAKLCDQLEKNGSLTDKHLEDLKDAGCELNDGLEEEYKVDPRHLEKLKADLDNLKKNETEDQACQSLGDAVIKGGVKIVSAIVDGYLQGIGQELGQRTVEFAFRDSNNQQGVASNSNGLETTNTARSDDAQQANGQKGFSAIDIADDVVNKHFVRNGK